MGSAGILTPSSKFRLNRSSQAATTVSQTWTRFSSTFPARPGHGTAGHLDTEDVFIPDRALMQDRILAQGPLWVVLKSGPSTTTTGSGWRVHSAFTAGGAASLVERRARSLRSCVSSSHNSN